MVRAAKSHVVVAAERPTRPRRAFAAPRGRPRAGVAVGAALAQKMRTAITAKKQKQNSRATWATA